eukprot:s526_g20.t1
MIFPVKLEITWGYAPFLETACAPARSPMALDQWIKPAPGVEYGLIVMIQTAGCLLSVVLWVLQRVASQGNTPEYLEWIKDSGWWIVVAPFWPAMLYYSLVWQVQRAERSKAKME